MYGKKNDSMIEHVTMIYMYYNMDVSMVTILTATIPLLFMLLWQLNQQKVMVGHVHIHALLWKEYVHTIFWVCDAYPYQM